MSTYKRKTHDEYSIQQYTGPQYGWEEVTTEDTWQGAIDRCQEYKDNQPEYPVRIKKHRVKIELEFPR